MAIVIVAVEPRPLVRIMVLPPTGDTVPRVWKVRVRMLVPELRLLI